MTHLMHRMLLTSIRFKVSVNSSNQKQFYSEPEDLFRRERHNILHIPGITTVWPWSIQALNPVGPGDLTRNHPVHRDWMVSSHNCSLAITAPKLLPIDCLAFHSSPDQYQFPHRMQTCRGLQVTVYSHKSMAKILCTVYKYI